MHIPVVAGLGSRSSSLQHDAPPQGLAARVGKGNAGGESYAASGTYEHYETVQHPRPTAGSRGGKAKGPYHSNVLNTSYKRPFGGV